RWFPPLRPSFPRRPRTSRVARPSRLVAASRLDSLSPPRAQRDGGRADGRPADTAPPLPASSVRWTRTPALRLRPLAVRVRPRHDWGLDRPRRERPPPRQWAERPRGRASRRRLGPPCTDHRRASPRDRPGPDASARATIRGGTTASRLSRAARVRG